ncbi:MAG: hypothetical protein FWD98_04775 [Defluviitaleaceae bacterium]|nr:hypothetical protein [Defluviitaleaceae bacterium]
MAYILAFEGIDGTGKGTQAQILHDRLTALGSRCLMLSFPDYDSFIGRDVGVLLSGRNSVTAATLDAKSMALWFAAERFRTFNAADRSGCDYVILNRYVMSNAVYQSMRVEPQERDAFTKWLLHLEHTEFGLPHPDTYFIFDVHEELSAANVARKGHRGYTGDNPDVYEASPQIQTAVRRAYRDIARHTRSRCEFITCMNKDGSMRPAHEIADEVFAKLPEGHSS